MVGKMITKRMHDRLDRFVMPQQESNEMVQNQPTPQTKKTIRKNDGLIERIDKKIYITEDNRQLLND